MALVGERRHEGARESKGRGGATSKYCWGALGLALRWWWSGGDEAAESGRIRVSERRRREGCMLVRGIV